MAINLHVRDLPSEVHRKLTERAARRRTSLRRYTIEVLTEHCARPTMEEWLAELAALPAADVSVSGAEAVRMARDEADRELDLARGGA